MGWFSRKSDGKRRSSGRIGSRAAPKKKADSQWSLSDETRHAMLRFSLRAVVAMAMIGTVFLGTRRLEAYVLKTGSYDAPAEIYYTRLPDSLAEHVHPVVEAVAQGRAWSDDALCRDIGWALEDCAWVSSVDRIRRFAPGRVVIDCRYRDPFALVQKNGVFYLLARDGVRLPGTYRFHPDFPLIQESKSSAPEPGIKWSGDDVQAAMNVLAMIREEAFAEQISGILLGNFDGQIDKSASRIVLATPSGGRIGWGSAPGSEIEENTPEQKIQILRENYRRWGSADAGMHYIDISVYPDRFITGDAPYNFGSTP
jgi:hypothetical protein